MKTRILAAIVGLFICLGVQAEENNPRHCTSAEVKANPDPTFPSEDLSYTQESYLNPTFKPGAILDIIGGAARELYVRLEIEEQEQFPYLMKSGKSYTCHKRVFKLKSESCATYQCGIAIHDVGSGQN